MLQQPLQLMLVTELFGLGAIFCLWVIYQPKGSNSSLPTLLHCYLEYIWPSTKNHSLLLIKYHAKKFNEDNEEWEALSRANVSCEACIIHCTKSTEKLTQLPSIESWLSLLDAARICQHQPILDIAVRMKEGDVPHLQYHRKCRNLYAKKGKLDRITKKRQVYFSYFMLKHCEKLYRSTCFVMNLKLHFSCSQ